VSTSDAGGAVKSSGEYTAEVRAAALPEITGSQVKAIFTRINILVHNI
jgi:hypothetical protein